jgi:hypothetical protein
MMRNTEILALLHFDAPRSREQEEVESKKKLVCALHSNSHSLSLDPPLGGGGVTLRYPTEDLRFVARNVIQTQTQTHTHCGASFIQHTHTETHKHTPRYRPLSLSLTHTHTQTHTSI